MLAQNKPQYLDAHQPTITQWVRLLEEIERGWKHEQTYALVAREITRAHEEVHRMQEIRYRFGELNQELVILEDALGIRYKWGLEHNPELQEAWEGLCELHTYMFVLLEAQARCMSFLKRPPEKSQRIENHSKAVEMSTGMEFLHPAGAHILRNTAKLSKTGRFQYLMEDFSPSNVGILIVLTQNPYIIELLSSDPNNVETFLEQLNTHLYAIARSPEFARFLCQNREFLFTLDEALHLSICGIKEYMSKIRKMEGIEASQADFRDYSNHQSVR